MRVRRRLRVFSGLGRGGGLLPAAERGEEEGGLLGGLGRLDGPVTRADRVQVQQRLPVRARHQAQRRDLVAELLDRRQRPVQRGLRLRVASGRGLLERGRDDALPPLARRHGRRDGGDVHLAYGPRGHVREQCAVCPQGDADAVLERGREELARGGEGEGGAGAGQAQRVDQVARWEIPDADRAVRGGGQEPAAVGGDAMVVNALRGAGEGADEGAGGDVEDAEVAVGGGEGEEAGGTVEFEGVEGGLGWEVK